MSLYKSVVIFFIVLVMTVVGWQAVDYISEKEQQHKESLQYMETVFGLAYETPLVGGREVFRLSVEKEGLGAQMGFEQDDIVLDYHPHEFARALLNQELQTIVVERNGKEIRLQGPFSIEAIQKNNQEQPKENQNVPLPQKEINPCAYETGDVASGSAEPWPPQHVYGYLSEWEGEQYRIQDGYLCYQEEKLFDEKQPPFWDESDGADTLVHRVDKEDLVYLFFMDGAGCGGCYWFAGDYVVHDKHTEEAVIASFDTKETSPLFERGMPGGKIILAPHGGELVYVTVTEEYTESTERQEAVWRFNLLTEEEQLVQEIPRDQTVVDCLEPHYECFVRKESVFWQDGSVVVLPSQKMQK